MPVPQPGASPRTPALAGRQGSAVGCAPRGTGGGNRRRPPVRPRRPPIPARQGTSRVARQGSAAPTATPRRRARIRPPASAPTTCKPRRRARVAIALDPPPTSCATPMPPFPDAPGTPLTAAERPSIILPIARWTSVNRRFTDRPVSPSQSHWTTVRRPTGARRLRTRAPPVPGSIGVRSRQGQVVEFCPRPPGNPRRQPGGLSWT